MQVVVQGFKVLSVLALGVFTTAAYAADISLVSGLFKKESSKIEGKNAGSTSVFGLGGRFHDDLDEMLAWYGQAELGMNSYSAPDGRRSPDNGVSLKFGGGVRHYFKPFATAVVPFASVGGDVRNQKEVVWTSNGYVDTQTNGLYYNAAIGLRTGLDSNIFVELELPLFDRALFAVAKKTTIVDGATPSESKEETTYNELWVDSFGPLQAARVAVGYKF